ncbi:putative DNA methylase [Klebsiella phage vB_KpM_FBKp34]|nr:putative DNA methylase [Klebsiella phage vB_KpM_FBKp34]
MVIYLLLTGGKGKKTKILRSLTPRGWAKAVFESNSEL